VHCALPTAFCRISVGSIVQASLVTFSTVDPAACRIEAMSLSLAPWPCAEPSAQSRVKFYGLKETSAAADRIEGKSAARACPSSSAH